MDVFENDSESDVVLYALKTEAPFVYIVYSSIFNIEFTATKNSSLYEKEVQRGTAECG